LKLKNSTTFPKKCAARFRGIFLQINTADSSIHSIPNLVLHWNICIIYLKHIPQWWLNIEIGKLGKAEIEPHSQFGASLLGLKGKKLVGLGMGLGDDSKGKRHCFYFQCIAHPLGHKTAAPFKSTSPKAPSIFIPFHQKQNEIFPSGNLEDNFPPQLTLPWAKFYDKFPSFSSQFIIRIHLMAKGGFRIILFGLKWQKLIIYSLMNSPHLYQFLYLHFMILLFQFPPLSRIFQNIPKCPIPNASEPVKRPSELLKNLS